MLWFWLSILAATLYAGTNFIDKYLVAKTLKDISITAVSTIGAIAGLPIALLFSILVLFFWDFPNLRTFILGTLAGWILIVAFQAYYKALRLADASIVASLFQLIIPFNYVLGLVFLNENPSAVKLLGCLAIMTGAMLIGFESVEGKYKFHKSVLLWMSFSSILVSLSDVIFKSAAQNSTYVQVLFSEYTGTILLGLILLAVLSGVRTQVREAFGANSKRIIVATQANEFVSLSALVSMRYAMTLMPIVLVQAVMGIQPLALLVMGTVLTIFLPKIVKENISSKHLLGKTAAVVLITVGCVVVAV